MSQRTGNGKRALVIGGGFFGCNVACLLSDKGYQVTLVEAGEKLMTRASYHNQARVHNGYHYPRSVLTALRSRINLPRFVADYSACVDSSFDKYYAISAIHSKVNAAQFRRFCNTIDAEITEAPKEIADLFDRRLVEKVFKVKEYAFDAVILRMLMEQALAQGGVDVLLGTKCADLHDQSHGRILATLVAGSTGFEFEADLVFNCTYSGINTLLKASKLAPIPVFKHEFTEMALLDLPEPLRSIGVTVMCGPFFSMMPFPARKLHSFSHVRYTPHCQWRDDNQTHCNDEIWETYSRQSRYETMLRDAARYLPLLKEAHYVDSLWEIKTILLQSEVDDSRPILFHRHPQLSNLYCVMGGKIDNIYDLSQELEFIV